MAGNHVDQPHAATVVAAERPQWRRVAVEVAGYVGLIWAAVLAFNVYTFADPAAATVTANMGHVGTMLTHLPRNFAFLFGLSFVLAAGIAPGDAVLRAFRIPARDLFDRIAFGMAAGLAVFTALAYLLASLHLLRFPVEATILIVCFAASATSIRRWFAARVSVPDEARLPRAVIVVLWVILGATLYVALLAALTPEVGFDARYYHLTAAERYAQHGGFYNLVATERINAFALPHYQEALYAFGWVLFGQIGAKLFAWGDAVVTVLVLVAFARAWFSSTAAGLVAAVVLFASPVVTWSATTANNDLAAIPFVVLALHTLLTWRATNARAALCAAGVFAGLTYGVKTFGAFTYVAVGVAVLCILLARKTPRRVLLGELVMYAGCGFLALLPALATAMWMVGDPIYPVALGIFPNRYGVDAVGTNLSSTVASRLLVNLAPANLVQLPWRLSVDTLTYRDLTGPIWLATLPLWVGLPFLARRHAQLIRPIAIVAAAYTAFVVLSGAVEFRYLEPILPLVALLIGYGIVCLDWRAMPALRAILILGIVVFGALGNGLATPLNKNALSPYVMGLQYLNWPYLYEGLPDSAVQLQYVPTLVYTNEHLDPLNDRIYDAAGLQIMNLYSQVELYNGNPYGGPVATGEWTLASPDAFARLREAGCTYVVIPKTMTAQLRSAPVWRHLRFVVEKPSINGPNVFDDLYKVVD